MINLTDRFLTAYPDAYVDGGFVVVTRGRVIYHPTQRMMMRWDRGFNDPVNDENVLIRYGIYPCEEHTSPNGDTWVSNDRVPTFQKVVSVEEFNTMLAECKKAGYQLLRTDASTDPTLVNSEQPDAELQQVCDRMRFQRSMRANGFG